VQAVQDVLTRSVPGEVGLTTRARLQAYFELTKPGITVFIMLTAAVGYWLAPGPASAWKFAMTVLGTGLTSAAACTLNEWAERLYDARMKRTARRPLPTGRVSSSRALWLGNVLTLLGLGLLVTQVGPAAAVMAGLSWVSYLFAYTPLKRYSHVCTYVGGIPGALPIVAGWSGRGGLDEPGAWALFLLMFFWQMPHFFSLAWLCRDDYRNAGFKMLTCDDPDGRRTSRVSMVFSALLAVSTALPFVVGLTGPVYGILAPLFGLVFFVFSLRMRPSTMQAGARRLFLLSLIYLPAVLTLAVLDRAG